MRAAPSIIHSLAIADVEVDAVDVSVARRGPRGRAGDQC